MSNIVVNKFEGIAPRYNKRKLNNDNAQTAENCLLLSGSLVPLKDTTDIQAVAAGTESVFLYNGTWLTWTTDVDVERSPVFEDAYDRIYYTGDGAPKVYGGSPAFAYDLGLPKPTNTPSVAAAAKTATTWSRDWFYFFEGTDGTQYQTGSMTEGVEVTESVVGTTYTATIPAKDPSTPSNAFFVLWFSTPSGYGSLYPEPSKYRGNTTLSIDGALVTGTQTNVGSTATVTLEYDTSAAGDYVVSRRYVYTYVTAWGEESEPSTSSDIVDVSPVQDAIVANMDTSVSGNYNVTHKNIYRTVTSADGSVQYQYVAQIAIGTASYTDSLTDADTAEALPSTNWQAPPSNLAGLVSLPNGIFAGFVGKSVYFSEQYFPHAWNSSNAITLDYDIVGLGVSENSIVAVTTGYPYVITGYAPDAMTVSRINLRQSCSSKSSICNAGVWVIYASPDGMVAVQGGVGKLISDKYYRRSDWQALTPSGMKGEVQDMIVYMFHSSGCVIFDFDEGRSAFTTSDETAAAVYSDLETDTLYVVQSTTLKSFNTGSNKTATWKSKEFDFPGQVTFNMARVTAASYPVTLKVYAEESLIHTQTVTDNNVFRLPAVLSQRAWEFQVESAYEVEEVALVSGVDEFSRGKR